MFSGMFLCFNSCICVCDLTIYVLCLLSSIVPFAHTTVPRCPAIWGPTAQKTGKHLRCGPSELSASLYPSLSRLGAPWGLSIMSCPSIYMALWYNVMSKYIYGIMV